MTDRLYSLQSKCPRGSNVSGLVVAVLFAIVVVVVMCVVVIVVIRICSSSRSNSIECNSSVR